MLLVDDKTTLVGQTAVEYSSANNVPPCQNYTANDSCIAQARYTFTIFINFYFEPKV
jgi:hypothetical protein